MKKITPIEFKAEKRIVELQIASIVSDFETLYGTKTKSIKVTNRHQSIEGATKVEIELKLKS